MVKERKIFYLFLSAAILFLMQCSPTQRHKTLVMFFDGVPESDSITIHTQQANLNTGTVIKSDSIKIIPSAESKFNLHKPYKDHQCEKCHDGNNIGHLIKPQFELCFTCHDDFAKKYAYVHGPVSSGYCLTCHNPHMSENKDLLTRVNDNVCFYCHTKEDLRQNKVHEGTNDSDCMHCHNPHGGKDRYLAN